MAPRARSRQDQDRRLPPLVQSGAWRAEHFHWPLLDLRAHVVRLAVQRAACSVLSAARGGEEGAEVVLHLALLLIR